MKKLKNKLFFTIFFIFTFSLLLVFSISNYQFYKEEKIRTEGNLKRLVEDRNNIMRDPNNNEPKIFADTTLYSVILNNKNEIVKVISHSEVTETEEIKEVANKILNTNNKKMFVGNLYFNRYSYGFKSNNTLIIIDNINTTKRLNSHLNISLIVFIILEVLVFLISKLLTKWISKPVEDSFENQKRFIADASHELKTPIAVIMSNVEAYESDSDLKWINNIKNETEKSNKLITELLDLAKLEEGNNKELYKDIDLSKTLEKSILRFESLAFERNVKFKYDIKNSVKYKCNETQINQLFSILIDNAIEHSYSKSIININLDENKEGIILNISNKGDNIKEEDLDKIFERFYRVDKSRNRNSNHYGLGLSIAKSIVNNHNGEIKVESKNNLTTFKVIFR